eukprot:179874_1
MAAILESVGSPDRDSIELVDFTESGPEKWKLAEKFAVKFLEEESNYVLQGLRVCMEAFLLRLEKHVELNQPILSSDEITQLFASYRLVYDFSCRLLKSLSELRLEGKGALVQGLGRLLKDYIPFFKLYQDYNSKVNEILKYLKSLLKSNASFKNFCAVGEACFGSNLEHYLKLPINRLPQYLEGLGQVYIYLPDKGTDFANALGTAVFDIKMVTDEITKSIKQQRMQRRIFTINTKIFSGKLVNAMIPKRYALIDGTLQIVQKDGKQKNKSSYFILFNDCLLWGTPKTFIKGATIDCVIPTHFMVVRKAEPKEVTRRKDSGVDKKNNNFIFSVSNERHGRSVLLAASTEARMKRWMASIKEAIATEFNTLQPTNPHGLLQRMVGKKQSGVEALETLNITNRKMKAEIQKRQDALQARSKFHPIKQRAESEVPDRDKLEVKSEIIKSMNTTANSDRSRETHRSSSPAALTNGHPAKDSTETEIPVPPAPAHIPPPPAPKSQPRPFGRRASVPQGTTPPPPPLARQASANRESRSQPALARQASPLQTQPPPPSLAKRASEGDGNRTQLLSNIRSGTELKKVDPASIPKSEPDTRVNLLSSIRGGISLKKAPPTQLERRVSSGNDLLHLLNDSLSQYRKFVEDEHEEVASDDEWV